LAVDALGIAEATGLMVVDGNFNSFGDNSHWWDCHRSFLVRLVLILATRLLQNKDR